MRHDPLRAILWLRWRLTRNQLMRGGGVGAALAAALAFVLVTLMVGAGAGGFALGALVLGKPPPMGLMAIWDGLAFFFLLFWMVGLLVEIQRSEALDLGRLLHLPVSLREVFFLNYLSSHATLHMALGLPFLLGVATGLVVSRGPQMLLLIPLLLAFVFMVGAWVYHLRGWLVTLMMNPRRRRTVVVCAIASVVLLGQLPNLLNVGVKSYVRRERQRLAAVQSAPEVVEGLPEAKPGMTQEGNGAGNSQPPGPRPRHRGELEKELWINIANLLGASHPVIPFLWVAHGARTLAEGSVAPALGLLLASVGLGWLGIRTAYAATVAFYMGQEKPRPRRRRPRAAPGTRTGRNWVEARVPLLRDETAAMALAQLRSMSRAPEIRLSLAMNLFFMLALPAFMLGGALRDLAPVFKPFAALGAITLPMLGMVQLLFNQFGFDREGFRALVLLPTSRRSILLGKNLALAPVAALATGVILVVVAVFLAVPPLLLMALTLQGMALFLVLCGLGNLVSILVPFRVAPGSLKATKMPFVKSLLVFGSFFVFPLAVLPMALPPLLGLVWEWMGWASAAPVHLASSALLTAAAAALYGFSLGPAAQLLERRETEILRSVSEVAE